MPLNDFLKVLDDIKKKYDPAKILVAITGGEPLLREDIVESFKEIKKRGFFAGMVSNGYNLSETLLKLLIKNGLSTFTISLDGLKNSHNWLRNNSQSFSRALGSIRLAAKHEDLSFDTVTCIHNGNIEELNDIKKLLHGSGVKKWRLFTVFPKGRAKELTDKFILTDANFIKLLEFIKQTNKEKQIQCSFGCDEFLGKYEGIARKNLFYCSAGINVGGILSDGSISGCTSIRSEYIQGSIFKDNFVDVWENKFGIMRDRAWTKKDICLDCKVYEYCEGNGMHLWNDNKLSNCYFHNAESNFN